MNGMQAALALGLILVFVVAAEVVLWKNAAIRAVFKRNVVSYFSGVLGYLFIFVFVVAGGMMAFRDQFFANNLANLDQLSIWFPWLLLFIVPAITMSAWADEKKLGTDELLFTLPASDIEILIGKYFAVLAVYTIALAFSITHAFVLGWIGEPDMGLLFTTYFGYWLAGAALLSAGMFASVLTSSSTVAFVLGSIICAIPVGVGTLGNWSEFIRSLSVTEQLHEFGIGLIPLSGMAYFISLAILMLYLNSVFISKRHWSSQQRGNMGLQFAIRAASLGVILISLNVVTSYASRSIDMTAEKLYSLSDTTRGLVKEIKADSQIMIQAFISPEVPREYVSVRKRLVGLLRQYDQLGGDNIDVRFVDVEPFSEQADEAKLFGIASRQVQTERGGKSFLESVFMGVVITSPRDEVVVPFFDLGIPLEYELTRSIRTASKKEKRKTVGILNTDARVHGGFDMQSFRSLPEWRIVTELKKQYTVEEVAADSAIDEDKYDVLISILPSSLTQPQMTNFVDYVKKGKPTLIFDDPMPVAAGGLQLAPRQPKPRPGGMFGQQGPPPEQKADGGLATTLLSALDIAWDNGQVVWDYYNPHPEFADLPPEYVFISGDSGTAKAFSPESSVTSGLQEIVCFFPGTFSPREKSRLEFKNLLLTGPNSGIHDWNDIVEGGGFPMGGLGLRQDRSYFKDEFAHLVAAKISSQEIKNNQGIDVIYVADADIVSDQMFALRETGLRRSRESANMQFDNVTFVLNAVDVLAGDESLVEIRKRRPTQRTLVKVEERTQKSINQQIEEQQKAEKDADSELEKARKRFADAVKRIEDDDSLDPQTKAIMIQNAQENQQRQAEVAEAKIDRVKKEKVEQIKAETQRDIRHEENFFRCVAIIVPPIPAIALGIIFLLMRLSNERRDVDPSRAAP